MKRKTAILAAIVISASIGCQVLSAACIPSLKVGNLSFALSDDYQINVLLSTGGGVAQQSQVTVPYLTNCNAKVQYVDKVAAVNTARVIAAIGKAVGHTFTSRAQLALVNYENYLPAPPYPPYLVVAPANTYNGPREWDGEQGGFVTPNFPYDHAREIIVSMGNWPNHFQIDWVDYDDTQDNTITNDDPNDPSNGHPTYNGLPDWPKARVFVSDPNGTCLDVTGFFSIEEAYCYFCWDTVDRVTKGTFSTLKSGGTTGDICIGGQQAGGCVTKGSGTTKFYLTIKFNNIIGQNIWIDGYTIDTITEGNGWITNNYTIGAQNQSVVDWLSFSVGGVVTYPWTIKNVNGAAWAMGTMTMSQANGYGQNPWCGVFTGSVKITETDDCKIPVCGYQIPLLNQE